MSEEITPEPETIPPAPPAEKAPEPEKPSLESQLIGLIVSERKHLEGLNIQVLSKKTTAFLAELESELVNHNAYKSQREDLSALAKKINQV